MIKDIYSKCKPMKKKNATVAERVPELSTNGGCYFPPKTLLRMSKIPSISGAVTIISRVSTTFPLEKDLCEIFNLGDRPMPFRKLIDSVTTRPSLDKWVKKQEAKGRSPGHYPIKGKNGKYVQPSTCVVVRKYSRLLQCNQSFPQYYVSYIIKNEYPRLAPLRFAVLSKPQREEIICRIADMLMSESRSLVGGHLFMDGKKLEHIESVMAKQGIKRIKCLLTKHLIPMSDAVEVETFYGDGERAGKGYISGSMATAVIRIGRFDNERRCVVPDKSSPMKILLPAEQRNMTDTQDNGDVMKLALVQQSNSMFAITNLKEITTAFISMRRGLYRLDSNAVLMNYTTPMGMAKTFKTDHLHRCGFEVEVSMPYTTDNAPRINNRLIDPHEFCKLTEWAPTFDRSVEPGFELKSPVISFNSPQDIRNAIPEEVKKLIDRSTKGDNCGGHIHYSHKDLGPEYLFRYIQRWAWLFAIIYPQRIGNHYCELTSKPQSDKYQWLRLREGRIEVRIFPAFRKTTALAWRAGLLARMAMTKPGSVDNTIKSWAEDDQQIATHAFAVRSPNELTANFNSQKVQLQLLKGLGLTPDNMRGITDALSKTEAIE